MIKLNGISKAYGKSDVKAVGTAIKFIIALNCCSLIFELLIFTMSSSFDNKKDLGHVPNTLPNLFLLFSLSFSKI